MKKLRFVSAIAVLCVSLSALAAPPQASAPSKKGEPLNLAILLFDGVQIIDYTGPYEVFGQAYKNDRPLFNVYTVAEKPGALTTSMGMTVIPRYTFENAPKAEVILLPGGKVLTQLENAKVMQWVQESAANAQYVLSVCNGAFYLGKAGLLDGLTATTFHGLIDPLRTLAPKAKVVTDRRFVDNGKIITSAGLSAGIDGALHLVERVAGRGTAQQVALNLEYNWQPDSPYARASFADLHFRKAVGRGFDLPEGTEWSVLSQQGGTDNWEKNWEVRGNLGGAELLKVLDTKLAEKWTRQAPGNGGALRTSWRFADEDGKPWDAVTSVQPLEGQGGAWKLTVKLARADVAARSPAR